LTDLPSETTSVLPLFTFPAASDETAENIRAAANPSTAANNISFLDFIQHLSIEYLKPKAQKKEKPQNRILCGFHFKIFLRLY
jgi:hypothetical protein